MRALRIDVAVDSPARVGYCMDSGNVRIGSASLALRARFFGKGNKSGHIDALEVC